MFNMLSLKILLLTTGVLTLHAKQVKPMPKPSLCHDKHGVLMAIPDSCNGFLICIHGNAIVSSCSSSYRFNPVKGICDHPANVDCREHASEAITDISVRSICEEEDTDMLLPDISSCSQYYECRTGIAYRHFCPTGMHFNSMIKLCQAPVHAKCYIGFNGLRMRMAPKPLKSSICSSVPTGTLLEHNSDCGKFYSCAHGRAMESQCPIGLHFSAANNRCEYPNVANCSLLARRVQ